MPDRFDDAGIVDQDIQAPKSRFAERNQCLNIFVFADIASDGFCLTTGLANHLCVMVNV